MYVQGGIQNSAWPCLLAVEVLAYLQNSARRCEVRFILVVGIVLLGVIGDGR